MNHLRWLVLVVVWCLLMVGSVWGSGGSGGSGDVIPPPPLPRGEGG